MARRSGRARRHPPGLEESPHGLERKQFIRRERHSSLAGETQYAFLHVLLRDAAYGQIPRATRAGKHLKAAGWIESLGRPDDHAEMLAHHYLAALELARAAHQDTTGLAARARPALQRAGDHALALNAYPSAARLYRAALALWPQDAREQRAGLLRLLGTVLYETGDLEQAEAVLLEGSHVAAAAGMLAVQARIRVLLAEIHAEQDGRYAEALEECEAAAALLQSEGDSEGLAEAWLLVGKLRFWRAGDPLGAEEALERAGTYARLSATPRAELESRSWLVATLQDLPIPVDVAVGRAERLLEAASGDPWAEAAILHPLSRLYGYAGRFPDARAACTRSQAIYSRAGARLDWAICAFQPSRIEMIAGDPAAAERNLRQAYDVLRAMGERGWRADAVTLLAEAAYAQRRLGQALRLTEEAEALAGPGDIYAQARWRATRAKLLARRGQFGAAARLAEEAVAQIPATGGAPELAEMLVAQAEVSRLAGLLGDAEASLRGALQFYEDRRMLPLAEQTRTLLASLAEQRPPRWSGESDLRLRHQGPAPKRGPHRPCRNGTAQAITRSVPAPQPSASPASPWPGPSARQTLACRLRLGSYGPVMTVGPFNASSPLPLPGR